MKKYKSLFEKVPYKEIKYNELIEKLTHTLYFIFNKEKVSESSIYEDIYKILHRYDTINENNIKHIEKDFHNLVDSYIKTMSKTIKSLNLFKHTIVIDLMKLVKN